MTHKQWFNNVLHLHPVHEEGAQTAHSSLANYLHVKPKKKRIHSGIYSATVMEVDTGNEDTAGIQGMFAVWV